MPPAQHTLLVAVIRAEGLPSDSTWDTVDPRGLFASGLPASPCVLSVSSQRPQSISGHRLYTIEQPRLTYYVRDSWRTVDVTVSGLEQQTSRIKNNPMPVWNESFKYVPAATFICC